MRESQQQPDGAAASSTSPRAEAPAPASSRARWRKRGVGWLAALACAGLFVLAFPTTELAPLAFVALVPMLVALPTRTRWQRFRLGFVAGFVIELVLFRWIPFTMTEMTSISGPLTWGMAVAYAAWHGLRFGVFAVFAEPTRRAVAARWPGLAPVALGILYMSVEWLWPVIFPWALGNAVWELPGMTSLAALQGVPLMTGFVALVNALVADALTRAPWRRLVPGVATLVGLSLLAAILAPAAGSDTMRVAIVQPNYTLAEKKKANLEMRGRLLERLEAQLRALPPATYDLVVASEGAFPMWWRLDADTAGTTKTPVIEATRRVQRAIAEGPRASAIIGGLRRDDANRTRNSAVQLAPDGRIVAHYDKQTLVPFSEYVPLADVFPALADIRGIGNLEPGDRPCAFDVPLARGGVVRVACGICYETMFADGTRRDIGEARALVNLTIDTWFGTSTAPRMHLMTQAARAAELGVPLVRSALTGISASLDLRGRVVAALPRDAPGVLDATVVLGEGTTVFRAIGQWLAPLGTLAIAAALLEAWWRARRAKAASR